MDEVRITKDTATPAIKRLRQALTPTSIKRVVGATCLRLLQGHLRAKGPNKRGWPSTGFYEASARNSNWDETPEGVSLTADHPEKPGSLRQRYHGGTIRMKDKMLAIPARAEFAARSPTEFTNLRLAVFRGGSVALVVGKGGVGRVDFSTGRERNVKGAGARSEAMVAFWLKEEVNQDADPTVIPTNEQFIAAAKAAILTLTGGKS